MCFLAGFLKIKVSRKTKNLYPFWIEVCKKDRQRPTLPAFRQVPSAWVGLTSLFGMGRGDHHRYCHLKVLYSINN